MPPVIDPSNVYSEIAVGKLSPAVASARPLVYVPSANPHGGSVTVIDQTTMLVVASYRVGNLVQHVVPSYDLKTLYANASASNRLVPFDPITGTPGPPISVPRPYNLYFTPDGTHAVVMVESQNRMAFYSMPGFDHPRYVSVPCRGVNHADWSADGRYFLVTCEFSGQMLKVDTTSGSILGVLDLPAGAMPQDVRLTPDGHKFYVADMMHGGVWIVDGEHLVVTGKIETGRGAHGIYPSRDGMRMYVSNRGRLMNEEGRRSHEGDGSVSVLDPATDTVIGTWTIPGGGSPDMGGLSADGTRLWLSGRYDAEVYVFDTSTGTLVARIKTPSQPHGLLVWPQPGRYSLGHTGNLR